MGRSVSKGRVTVLGCGGSGGVPLIGNVWGECDPANPKNHRTRSSIHVDFEGLISLQIDTGPDFRSQYVREKIPGIDAVFYTHAHSDHVNGIDDLRYMAIVMKTLIPVYGHTLTIQEIHDRFEYLFEHKEKLYKPLLTKHCWEDNIYGKPQTLVLNETALHFTPVYQIHGSTFSIGYRFGDFAYSTDVSDFPLESLHQLQGIKTWLVDCGQYGQDFIEVHPNLERVQQWNDIVKADRVILTHLTAKSDFKIMGQNLPKGFEPAFDGLKIDLNLD